MTDPAEAPSAQRPRAVIRWSARVLVWFCWLAIAITAATAGLQLLNAIPAGWISRTEPDSGSTVFSFGVGLTDPAANEAMLAGLRADWPNRIVGLLPAGLFIWALLSARACFLGVGRGAYFARPTILGLRNLSIAVLLYETLAPLITAIPRAIYFAGVKGTHRASLSAAIQFNEPVALILIFAAVVALVSTVMAHAAKIADENRQFV